jgi:hypothetical protein
MNRINECQSLIKNLFTPTMRLLARKLASAPAGAALKSRPEYWLPASKPGSRTPARKSGNRTIKKTA